MEDLKHTEVSENIVMIPRMMTQSEVFRNPTETHEHLKGLDLKQYCATSISLGIHHAVAILNDKDTKGAYQPIIPAKKLLNRMKERIK